ncbi:hypothetical protein ACHAW5_002384 [Stephanodiscus triporus]|uniref:Uncharacterized protein n=1 Tax=Stephanodiscus triporus TaxID=2934178 RepID=A0ABD3N6N3_9STRA
MKLFGALVLVFATSVSAGTIGDCKSFCNQVRKEALAETKHCAVAIKQSNAPKLFSACVEGRKKAFDQSCNPLCANAGMSISSFEGCQIIARNKGSQYVSWCRKGYDSMLQTLETLLDERSVILDIEINQDVEVKTKDKPAEDLTTLQHLEAQDERGETPSIDEAGSNGEQDWVSEIESVDIEPVRNDEEEHNETVTVVGADGSDGVDDFEYGGGEDKDREGEAREIQMNHDDANDEEISEL